MIKQLQILSATEAREINRMGEKPDITQSYNGCTKSLCAEVSRGAMCHGVCWIKELAEYHWQAIEDTLRTFRIDCVYLPFNSGDINKRLVCTPEAAGLIIGSQHQAEIINEITVRIILS